jgi:hypothetical protein
MQLQFELPHFLGKFRLKWFGIHASDRAHMMTGTVLNSGRSARRNTSLSASRPSPPSAIRIPISRMRWLTL